MLPLSYSTHGTEVTDFTVMQDGAPAHTANVVKDWFKQNEVTVINWPSYYPDFNPIENLWGYLVLKVYDKFRKFSTKEELQTRVLQEWANIPLTQLTALTDSIQKRCIEVIQNRGEYINY